ncbi:MAG TPA: hypothetical protein VNZ57_06825 [Longimicrobiales bacterium]|nr:hypothetical protein [Longimicrobiales bacterium]
MRHIELLRLTNRITPAELASFPGTGDLVVCDFYVEGIETGEEVAGGYRQGRILNVDHHAPTPRMWRRVSSTNLALERFEADGALGDDAVVVINHLDCDSILSSGIASGRLAPDPRFGEAAIAADHTGEENDIADLLQGLDAELTRRKIRDYEIPFENLRRLLDGRPLEPLATEALDVRRRRRQAAAALVSQGRFQRVGPLHFAILDEPMEGELFPALLPDATAIMLANPLPEDRTRWQVRIRLGLSAPSGFALSLLGIRDFDPNYGGRWNAASNTRVDPSRGPRGTALDPEEYARRLVERLEASLPAG